MRQLKVNNQNNAALDFALCLGDLMLEDDLKHRNLSKDIPIQIEIDINKLISDINLNVIKQKALMRFADYNRRIAGL